jgi:iron complex outermembrane receptor protein
MSAPVIALAILLAGASSEASAQSAVGVIEGRITDATQAVIVGATVTVERRVPAAVVRTVTDNQGRYRFEGLGAGPYSITVTANGFQEVVRHAVVTASQTLREDVALSPAPIVETVRVGFTGQQERTSLKYDVPVRDVPIAVTTYTASFIQAVNARRTDELFSYMTGVTRADNTAYDFTIRGVRAREPNSILIDGMPGLPARFGSPTLADVDRVELLRGPASVQFGQIQPGGVLNLITKRPTAERVNALSLRLGSIATTAGNPTLGRVEGDFSGRADASSHWLYRLTFSYDDNESFRNEVQEHSTFASPSITWVPNARTSLEASFSYRRERSRYDDGLVAPNNDITKVASIETRYQEPNDFIREDGWAATLRLTRALSARTTFVANWRSVQHDDYRREYENVQVAANLVTLQRRDREQQNHRRYHFLDTFVKTERATGGLRHTLAVGFNGGYELRSPEQLSATSSPTLNINLYAPVYGAPRPRVVPGTFRQAEYLNAAVYVQDHVAISTALKAIVAVRGSSQRAVYDDQRSDAGRTTRPSAWTPLAGLVFAPGQMWSAYGNVSTSFAPPNPEAEDATGQNNFVPERGRQLEIGSRLSARDGRFEIHGAAFQIRRQNVLQMLGANVTAQLGEERSRGSELEGRAQLVRGLQVIGGLSYTDAVITRDAVAINVGARVTNVPKVASNLWARYDIATGALRHIGFGVGVIRRGDRAGSLPAATAPALRLPGYTRTDADVHYSRGPVMMTLQAINLANRTYFESARSAIGIMPGTPRQLIVTIRTRF